jgi:HD superfamily phosphohydrolase
MHLASRFLLASLEHAEPQARKAAEEGIEAAVSEAIGEIGNAETAARELDHDGLVSDVAVGEDCRPYVLLAEQGLRLAALFHDLGHLPFSHDFEYALEQLAAAPQAEAQGVLSLVHQESGRDALHERIGHDLTYMLIRDAFAQKPSEAARVSFELARRILETPEAQSAEKLRETGGVVSKAEGAYAWLHTLIAGELDVDRCDYVLRDARSYAFESARFDLQRLIDNLTVVQDPESPNALVVAVLPQGQAAVESLLIARARIYQWGPRHHKVAQFAAALQYAIGEMLRSAVSTRGEHALPHPLHVFLSDLEEILSSAEKLKKPGELLARFGRYDDQWWMEQMRASCGEDPWFKLVCWRAPGPRSLWKRVVDFPEKQLADWNRRLPARTEVERLRSWDDAVRTLREDGVLVVRHRFEPWKPSAATVDDDEPDSALSFYDPNRGLIPVTDISYPVASLREAWMRDVQVHAFARDGKVAVCGRDVLERLMPGDGGV